MKIESILFSLFLFVLISCGGGSGGSSAPNNDSTSDSGGGSGGSDAPTVPQSIFFEGCADSTCTEQKVAAVVVP